MVTFNQINKSFKDFADAHYQVNSYGLGDVHEIAASGVVNYPLMWVIPQDSTLTDNAKVYESTFTIAFMDLVAKDERNENDVLSDMELIAFDFITQFQKPDYEWAFNPDGISIKRFTERFEDMVSGVAFDVSLRIPFVYDRCAIPASTIIIPSINI